MPDDKTVYDLYSQAFKRNAYATFAHMRQDHPVQYQPGIDGVTELYFVTRHADVSQVLTDEQHFARDLAAYGFGEGIPDPDINNLVGNHMLNKDGADHRRMRTLVTKAFTPARVREMRPKIQQIADDLIDAVEPQGHMDLVADYAYHLPTIVILEMIGIPAEDRDRFRAWTNAVVMPTLGEDDLAEFMRQMAEFLAYLRAQIALRRADPRDDLLSELVHAEEAGDHLNEGELFGMLMLLIVAGHETTVNLIANAMIALWRHPDQLAQLQADPGLMPTAVEEFLRYDGSVERAFTRYAMSDTEVGGTTIPAGSMVVPILAAANHDETVFADAEGLDITRQPNPHLGLGKGAHYCLGASLARMEAEIALNTLLQRLPDIRPSGSLDALEMRLTPTFRSVVALPVAWGD